MSHSLLPTLACLMTADQKLIFFHLLVKWRFKEIKIAYSSASNTDFSFVQYLIENIEILDDVWIQVSTIAKSLGYIC
jgi:2-isopropylmalate synthase